MGFSFDYENYKKRNSSDFRNMLGDDFDYEYAEDFDYAFEDDFIDFDDDNEFGV